MVSSRTCRGGGGTIARRLKSLADENYADIDRYKLTTVFDSDKTGKMTLTNISLYFDI